MFKRLRKYLMVRVLILTVQVIHTWDPQLDQRNLFASL